MKTSRPLSVLVTLLIVATVSQLVVASDIQAPDRGTVKIDDLNVRGAVIGLLAVPLGKVVTIDGEVVDGATLRMKAFDGVLLLQVSTVDGQKLPEPCAIRFGWFATADAKKLKGRVKLVGYETGQFTGVPGDAFQHIAPVASQKFHFESSFVVLKAL
jgi:hypothetical protein